MKGIKTLTQEHYDHIKEKGFNPKICRECQEIGYILVELVANARLIASAPDLYEAGLQMEAFIQTWKDVLLTNMTEEMLEKETNKLSPAIAKAEGGE